MKEGEYITIQELTKTWDDVLMFFNQMIEKQGTQLKPIRFLVRHIIEKNYSKKLFGATSMYNLAISLPRNNVIDYTKTLNITYDQLTQTVKFKYWNCPRNEREQKNINWLEECQATEVNDTFEHFINSNEDWRRILKGDI